MPSVSDQILALERFLGRSLPAELRELYMTGRAHSLGLMPLATGREYEASTLANSFVSRLLDAEGRFASALGSAMGNRDLARTDPDHVWPPSLLVIEDVGCAVYRAVDLDDPALRVIEYEHFDAVDSADSVFEQPHTAFRAPLVPHSVQHRFTVVADSLDEWAKFKAAEAKP